MAVSRKASGGEVHRFARGAAAAGRGLTSQSSGFREKPDASSPEGEPALRGAPLRRDGGLTSQSSGFRETPDASSPRPYSPEWFARRRSGECHASAQARIHE